MDESVVKVFEEQNVGTLKLSEAIRIGAVRTSPAFGIAFGGKGRACAIGAAYAAYFEIPTEPTALSSVSHFREFQRMHPELFRGTAYSALCTKIMSLNDNDEWTREQCADYAESLGY